MSIQSRALTARDRQFALEALQRAETNAKRGLAMRFSFARKRVEILGELDAAPDLDALVVDGLTFACVGCGALQWEAGQHGELRRFVEFNRAHEVRSLEGLGDLIAQIAPQTLCPECEVRKARMAVAASAAAGTVNSVAEGTVEVDDDLAF